MKCLSVYLRTNPHRTLTTTTYDARGRITQVTEAAPNSVERVTAYAYDAAGQLTTLTMPDGVIRSYNYDAAHRLREVTDNLGNRIEYAYDRKGNRTSEQTSGPDSMPVRTLEFTYDPRDRIAQVNAAGSLTAQLFDAVGNLLRETDPNGAITTHQYDPLHRLTETMDALSGVTRYAYDIQDHPTRVEAPNGAATGFIHDDLDNRLQETSPDRGLLTLAYDADGNVLSRTDARGITATYSYDALGRMLTVDYPGTESDAGYAYDTGDGCTFGTGRLCMVTDAFGTSVYAYDAFGNRLRHSRSEAGITYDTAYTYDAEDRLLSVAYPSGRRVEYGRDGLGRIARVELVTGEARTLLADGITYRADRLITGLTFGNGLAETRSYDLQGRLTAQSLGSVDSREYGYDANGNLTARTATMGSGTFTYDALNRLEAEATDLAGEDFTYDANGNRQADGTHSYGYVPDSNRLATIGNMPVTLDESGNLTAQDSRSFTYNPAGRLSQVMAAGTELATYHYDASGQRTRKVSASGTVIYHYDLEGRLLAESSADGPPLATYVWLDDRPLAQVTDSGVTFLYTDHLATPRLGMNANGLIVWRWDSDAFGATLADEDPDGDGQPVTVNLRFPGQYHDAETGLHYNYFRDYDPGTGRYIESDPIGLAGGDTNLFRYVFNNPMNFIDSDGLRRETIRPKPFVRNFPSTTSLSEHNSPFIKSKNGMTRPIPPDNRTPYPLQPLPQRTKDRLSLIFNAPIERRQEERRRLHQSILENVNDAIINNFSLTKPIRDFFFCLERENRTKRLRTCDEENPFGYTPIISDYEVEEFCRNILH